MNGDQVCLSCGYTWNVFTDVWTYECPRCGTQDIGDNSDDGRNPDAEASMLEAAAEYMSEYPQDVD